MNKRLAAKIKERRAEGGGITLTDQEQVFLRLCCKDIPYRTIARQMAKSPRTIDGYRDTLFRILEVSSRTGLVLWCFKTGFLKVKDIRLETRANKKKPRQK